MKVIKLPGNLVIPNDGTSKRTFECEEVYFSGDPLIVYKLNSKQWAVSRPSGGSGYFEDLSGSINGYNIYATDAAYALYHLGFWSKEDADRFYAQQIRTKEKNEMKYKIVNMMNIAKNLGYEVKKRRE